MPKTVILSAARTPIGKLGGGLASVDPTELGATAIKSALERADVAPEQVQHVVMGQVLQAGQGQIPSRQAQIKAGIPKEIPSETINKVCASGIRAAGLLDSAIRAGDLEIGVGGGMESMSNAPYMLKQALDHERTLAPEAEPPLARHLKEMSADRALLALWVNPRPLDAGMAARAGQVPPAERPRSRGESGW